MRKFIVLVGFLIFYSAPAFAQSPHLVESAVKQYEIPRELAELIVKVSAEEGIRTEYAFALVRVESVFKPSVVSRGGALGLTQLMPATARSVLPGVTKKELLTPEKNLRVGFRYLASMVKRYKGDYHLALLAYNRGPGAVEKSLKSGRNPENGYYRKIARHKLRL